MSDPKPGLIERLLMRVFEYQDIRDGGDLYLRRFFLYKHPDKTRLTRRLYLHKFYRGDKDRDHHSHPWKFTSLILKGGYWEETEHWVKGTKFFALDKERPVRYSQWYGVGRLLHRPATWAHRVILPAGKTAWTLVLTGPKERSWGFNTLKGFCYWKNYKDGVCFCYDDPNEVGR